MKSKVDYENNKFFEQTILERKIVARMLFTIYRIDLISQNDIPIRRIGIFANMYGVRARREDG